MRFATLNAALRPRSSSTKLNAKSIPALMPADRAANLPVRQTEALADGITDAAVSAFLETRRPAGQQDAETVERQLAKIRRGLTALEERLARHKGFGDAAINIAPTLEEKVDIIQNAIELAIMMGVPEPKVAILSAVETVNVKIRSPLDAAALCKMADRGQIRGGLLDGPLAFDNAVSLVAAKTKGIRSAVAGQADILVVPDLESGNMVAKQLEYLADALMAGVVLGARVPIVLTSRADTAETRTASCAIAQLMAHKRRQGVRL